MAKYRSKNTQLQVGDGATPTEAFTKIPQVSDINDGDGGLEEVDVTDHDSPSGSKEYLPGDGDPGTVTFPIHFDPALALHQQLIDDRTAGQTIRNYRIVHKDTGASIKEFAAYVQSVTGDNNVSDAMRLNVTLRKTGAPTWTYN